MQLAAYRVNGPKRASHCLAIGSILFGFDLLLYILRLQLRSCPDSQLSLPHFSLAGLT